MERRAVAGAHALLGLGVIFNTIQVHEIETGSGHSGDFGNVLSNPGRGTTFNNSALFASAGLGLDYHLPYSTRAGESGELLLGLRVGYAVSVEPIALPLTTAPGLGSTNQRPGFDGAFIRLVLGSGITQVR